MRENEGFDERVKFKLSLIMMRNIERLRQQGVFVSGSWFNRHVLMFKETIQSHFAKVSNIQIMKEGSELRGNNFSDNDSIFNIELGDMAIENLQNQIDLLNSSVLNNRAKKQDTISAKYKKVAPRRPSQSRSRSVNKPGGRDIASTPESSGLKKRSRHASVKKVIRGKPSGFEVAVESSVLLERGKDSEVKLKQNKDLTDQKINTSLDQDITPMEKSIEKKDDEGNKYLNYKSISGMDLVPRIRQPSPAKAAKNARDHIDGNPDCDCCQKFKVKFHEMQVEMDQLKI